MAVTNPPGFLQNAGNTHTAAQLRTYLAGLQAGNYSVATSLRARGGVHPSLGNELVVTQTGSPSMGVIVDTGVASIPGSQSGTQGNYLVSNDGQVTLSIAAASPTLPRVDIVVFNIRDSFYSGASNDSQLQVITGTPASSPVAPAAPDNSIILAQVAVAASATSITNANITDVRSYLAGVGGVINARSEAARPVAAEITEGQLSWTMDNNKLWAWDGSAWKQIYLNVPEVAVKIAENTLAAPAASISFTGIASTYRAIEVAWTSRDDWLAFNADNARFRVNNDPGANYRYSYLQVANAAVTGVSTVGATAGHLGITARGGATAGVYGAGRLTISGWNAPHTNNLVWSFQSGIMDSTTSTCWAHSGSGSYTGAGPYTRLDFLPDPGAANFVAGTQFVLYGYL